MTQSLHSRIYFTGTLVCETPVHVGGVEEFTADVDLNLMRDGLGRFLMPGTSLAGPLRAWLHRVESGLAAAESAESERLWGSIPLRNATQSISGASLLFVDDAPIASHVPVEIRDHVGIDRVSGAAANRIKFTRMIVPVGAVLPLRLTIDVRSLEDRPYVVRQLAILRRDLQLGLVRFGGSKTRGLGKLKLHNAVATEMGLDDRDDFLATLLAPRSIDDELEHEVPTASKTLRITAAWKPAGSMLVAAGADGTTVDKLPLVTAVDDTHVAFVLPGSSIKGSLRSHAERIVRTVLPIEALQPTAGRDDDSFLHQLDVPLVNLLFGSEKGGHERVGAMTFDDCVSIRRVELRKWQAVVNAFVSDDNPKRSKALSMQQLHNALLDAGLISGSGGTVTPVVHVAIDRWLQSSVTSKLFSELEVALNEWADLELTVDLERLGVAVDADTRDAALYLLLLTLRDLRQGWIAFGSGAAKGHGAVEVTSVSIDPSQSGDSRLGSTLLDWSDVDANFVRPLREAWENFTKGHGE